MLAQHVASRFGVELREEETQQQLLRRLECDGVLEREVAERLELDEAATRLLIDAQLRQPGWEADSARLRYGKGARPQKHRNLAIAEWPTSSGPADYVLFAGLTPLAAVEAKRANKDVAGVMPQAQRYCRDFKSCDEIELRSAGWGPEGEYRIPFAFSSNGRPYLRQLRARSGIWFRDLRRSENLATPLDGWYSPEGLRDLARQDVARAEEQLQREAFSCGPAGRGRGARRPGP